MSFLHVPGRCALGLLFLPCAWLLATPAVTLLLGGCTAHWLHVLSPHYPDPYLSSFALSAAPGRVFVIAPIYCVGSIFFAIPSRGFATDTRALSFSASSPNFTCSLRFLPRPAASTSFGISILLPPSPRGAVTTPILLRPRFCSCADARLTSDFAGHLSLLRSSPPLLPCP